MKDLLMYSYDWMRLFVLILAMSTQCNGAKINFQSSPSSLIEDLSPSLTLTCQLEDTATSGSIVGRRDVSQTSDNMASISSVIIMKDGNDVASISATKPAHVMDGATNVIVSGSLSGNADHRGFLHLDIRHPTLSQSGEFLCEINALSDSGHMVTFTSSLEVTSQEPSLKDLVSYVRNLSLINEDLVKYNAAMKHQMAALQQTVTHLSNISGKVVSFNAGLNHIINIRVGEFLIFDRVVDNTGQAYNPSNGQFVCKIPGEYDFSVSCLAEPTKLVDLDILHNSVRVFTIYGARGSSYSTAAGSSPMLLSKGDVVQVRSRVTTTLHLDHCYFSGFLVTAN